MRNFPTLALLFVSVSAVSAQVTSPDSVEVTKEEHQTSRFAVDLSGGELAASADSSQHVLARPWYDNIDIWGFGAFWFAATGADGLRSEAGFEIKESTVFIEAQAWENASLFMEIQTTPPLGDQEQRISTGEVYAHFRNILRDWTRYQVGLKVGRIDIPFGEEYLMQDAVDNAAISNTAAYPWLWDEGVLLYGKLGRVGWLASVTDGFIGRGADDDQDKALNLKLHGRPADDWYVSASVMRNGRTSGSAILLGGSLLQPVGHSHFSTAGESPSGRINAWLFQSDLRYSVPGRRVNATIGRGRVDDVSDEFDRRLTWVSIVGLHDLTRSVYVTAAYSEIGTYDDERGYHFGGEFLAGGNEAYGYDAKRFSRRSIGIGWRASPMSTVKLEFGSDRYWVIRQSQADPRDDDRSYYAAELAIGF